METDNENKIELTIEQLNEIIEEEANKRLEEHKKSCEPIADVSIYCTMVAILFFAAIELLKKSCECQNFWIVALRVFIRLLVTEFVAFWFIGLGSVFKYSLYGLIKRFKSKSLLIIFIVLTMAILSICASMVFSFEIIGCIASALIIIIYFIVSFLLFIKDDD